MRIAMLSFTRRNRKAFEVVLTVIFILAAGTWSGEERPNARRNTKNRKRFTGRQLSGMMQMPSDNFWPTIGLSSTRMEA
jgi:hypothetical protein